MRNFQDQIGPCNVQAQQQDQQAVENVVSRKHWKYARCLNRAAINDARIESQSRNNPSDCEEGENAIAQPLIVGIFGNFGGFQENISAIMHNQHQRSNAVQIAHPTQRQQQQRDDVM